MSSIRLALTRFCLAVAFFCLGQARYAVESSFIDHSPGIRIKESCLATESPLEKAEVAQGTLLFGNAEAADPAKYTYFNLSCPWEWSKYSCANQGQTHKANMAASIRLFSPSCDIAAPSAPSLMRVLSGRTVSLVGDSVQRQMLIALACLLHSQPDVRVVEDTFVWRDEWTCQGVVNCITGGPHSGFDNGCIQFSQPAPSGGGENYSVRICFTWFNSFFSFREHAIGMQLRPLRDIILYNAGAHFDEEEKVDMLRANLEEFEAHMAELPLVIYRESSPQHFKRPGGMFEEEDRYTDAGCSAQVDWRKERLSMKDREMLMGRLLFLRINPMAMAHGELKVQDGSRGATGAGTDCTHWCLPGMPDVWVQIFQGYLLEQLPALEALQAGGGGGLSQKP